MRRWSAAVAGFGLVLASSAVRAVAQEKVVVHEVGGRQIATVRAFVAAGASHRAGLGFVLIEAENKDLQPHDLECELTTSRWGQGNQRVHRAVALGGGERARFFLPLPSPLVAQSFVVRVDGDEQETSLGVTRSEGLVGLFLAERLDLQPQALATLQGVPSTFSSKEPVQVVGCAPRNAPADWRLFTAFDVVLVDGRSGLAEDRQEALRRYAYAGGTLVVADAPALPAGALRTLAGEVASGPVAHGLGVVVALPALQGNTMTPVGTGERLGRLPKAGHGPWPADAGLLQVQDIPGLGDAPVRAFLTIIVLFAIAVGPVNFVLLRRRRRPLLALLTVPLLGFGTTALLLGYGLLHDGFGVRGVVTSWTLLDQGRHEGASFAARTLFAGRAPARFPLGGDSMLLAPFASQSTERLDRWHFDAASGVLDGGALPSRTTTPLLSAQQGPMRARLAVRQEADGSLRLLGDGGIAAVGPVLLRDLQGQWWSGTAPSLQRADDAAARTVLTSLVRELGVVHGAEPPDPRYADWPSSGEVSPQVRDIGTLQMRLLVGGTLPPGGYLLRCDTAPWLDEHGLGVAYDAQRHFVSGRLAAEDFVR